jgi:hypothetical protein
VQCGIAVLARVRRRETRLDRRCRSVRRLLASLADDRRWPHVACACRAHAGTRPCLFPYAYRRLDRWLRRPLPLAGRWALVASRADRSARFDRLLPASVLRPDGRRCGGLDGCAGGFRLSDDGRWQALATDPASPAACRALDLRAGQFERTAARRVLAHGRRFEVKALRERGRGTQLGKAPTAVPRPIGGDRCADCRCRGPSGASRRRARDPRRRP